MADAFFKKREDDTKGKDDDKKLIDNVPELTSTYKFIITNVQTTLNRSYGYIVPLRTDLRGDGRQRIGLIKEIMNEFDGNANKIRRMDIGILMIDIIRRIEDLDKMSDNYVLDIEKYNEALQLICNSAFSLLTKKDKEIDELSLQLKRLELRLSSGEQPNVPKPEEIRPPTQAEIDEFTIKFKERLSDYKRYYVQGDDRSARLAKGRAYTLTQWNAGLKPIADKIFKEETSTLTFAGSPVVDEQKILDSEQTKTE